MVFYERSQVRGRGPVAFGHHDGFDFFAPLDVGHADDGGVFDRWVLLEDALDLARGDVLAAADDEVLGAAGDVEVAVVVHPADVPGV